MAISTHGAESSATSSGEPSAVLRPVGPDDGDRLWELLAGSVRELTGMASLPTTAVAAEQRCHASAATLQALANGSLSEVAGSAHPVLLVLESGADGALLGVTGCTIKYAVANYSVEIGTNRQGRGLSLRGWRRVWTCTELNATFLHGRARGAGLGTLLSRGRLLFLAGLADHIPNAVVSHLRGPMRGEPSAPFWQSFGVQALPQWSTSAEAEERLVVEPERLDDLADHTVPVDPAVLDVLGSVHRASLPAFRLLQTEGLQPNGMYDPVDGGPTLIGELPATATWRRRQVVTVDVVEPDAGSPDPASDCLLATEPEAAGSAADYRAVRALVEAGSESVGVSGAVAAALGLADGAAAVMVPLTPTDQRSPTDVAHDELEGGAVR